MAITIAAAGDEVMGNQTILGIAEDAATAPAKFLKLVDVIDVPDDVVGEYQTVDRTNLTNRARTSKPGLQDNSGAKNFTVRFSASKYDEINDLSKDDTTYWFRLFIGGPTEDPEEPADGTEIEADADGWGKDGMLTFKGMMKIRMNGITVGEYIEATLSIYMENEPVFEIPST